MKHSMDFTTRTNGKMNGQSSVQAQLKEHRIALFAGAYNHIEDGVSLTLNRLVKHLEENGASVLVFAPTCADPPIRHYGTLVAVPSFMAPGRPEYRLSLGLPAEARRRLKAFQPTLFHLATPDFLGYRALRLAKRWNIPVVASFHTHFSSYLKYYKLGAIEDPLWSWGRWFYRRCQQIYVPTESIADMLRQRRIETEIRIWPRGVDATLFNPAKRSLEWRRGLGIEDDEIVVTFISRLVWEKGVTVYADVIESLMRDGIPHRSMIVGDGPARATLEQKLPNSIFLGYLSGEEIARSYASSDIFVFPSETETFGNVTLEAMASGLPAVCADAAGSNSLVLDGKTGFLAPPKDSEAFAAHVKRLILDEDLRNRLSKAAFEASSSYSWPNNLSRVMTYYDEVLGNPVSSNGLASEPLELPAVRSQQPVSLSY